jgi:hypothetical protein
VAIISVTALSNAMQVVDVAGGHREVCVAQRLSMRRIGMPRSASSKARPCPETCGWTGA